jgi:hypothetical protein
MQHESSVLTIFKLVCLRYFAGTSLWQTSALQYANSGAVSPSTNNGAHTATQQLMCRNRGPLFLAVCARFLAVSWTVCRCCSHPTVSTVSVC